MDATADLLTTRARRHIIADLYTAAAWLAAELADQPGDRTLVLPYALALTSLAAVIDDWGPPGAGADSPTAPALDPGTE